MSFFIYALKHGASQDPDNRDGEQLGLIRLCGQCSAWHIPIIGITPMYLLKGMSKKRHTRAPLLTGVKKRHSHAHRSHTRDTSVALTKGQEQCSKS
jgi:hypothetical protein